ncbi:MAG: TonB family protein [Chromatiales bacterium]|nr:TonB family protein [Chromatiales bacterium]
MQSIHQTLPLFLKARPSGKWGRFGPLLVFSAVLHGSVISLWPDSESKPIITSGNPITVHLSPVLAHTDSTTAQQARSTPPRPQRGDNKPRSIHHSSISQKTEQGPSTPSKVIDDTTTHFDSDSISATSQDQALTSPGTRQERATLISQIEQELANHFYYPIKARKYGWQGEVHLAFSIGTDGTLFNIRIAQGSGYSTLDRAALFSLSEITRIESTLSDTMSLELPVIYRLHGG